MRQIVLICGLGAALMAGMAQAIEKQDSVQVAQVESVHALTVDAAPMLAQAEEIAAMPAFRVETAVAKTATGVGAGASNADRMRQVIGAEEIKLTSISSVTSPAKVPEDPGKQHS
jgi:hypothetical protein